MKEKAKKPIPRLPPLCKYLLDNLGDVTAEKKRGGAPAKKLYFHHIGGI